MYLPVGHNKVAKIIYDGVIQRNEIDNRMIPLLQKYTNEFVKIWWDTKIKKMPSLQHNKPDLVIWYKIDKTCFIINIAFGRDVNTTRNYNQKNDNYVLLLSGLKKLYPSYTFEILSIVLEATGLITTELAVNLRKLKIKNIEETADRCRRMALIGTMKIEKSVMNVKNT